MIPNVYELLNVSAVNAYVAGRIYGAGNAGDSPTYPYITWQVISGSPSNRLSEVPDTDRATVMVNVWSRSEAEARQTATAVRDALDPAGYQQVLIGPSRDPDTKSFRVQMDYSIWTYR